VRPSEVEAFLAPLPVRRLHGIGPATGRNLEDLGITTVAQLREAPVDVLLDRFGQWGRTMSARAWGIDDRSVHTRQVRKSLSTERTFAKDIRDVHEIDKILVAMAEEVANGLERRHLAASTITVKTRFPDFTTPTRSHTLPVPTSDASTIASVACDLIRRTDAGRREVRLLGVGVSNLVPEKLGQRALFEDG
jgi:DNA polymerase-4